MKSKPKIEKITIKHIFDNSTDLSWLGEYTNNVTAEELRSGTAFKRRNVGHRELKYFRCTIGVSEHREELQKMGYAKGVAEEMARSYCKADFDRMEGYARGHIWDIGIEAEATVSYPIGNGSKRIERLSSGGLWGISSDSENAYIEEVEEEELQSLIKHLKVFDVDTTGWKELEITREGC